MGEKLAHKIKSIMMDNQESEGSEGSEGNDEIDVVIPVPDTARTSAFQCAVSLNKPFREGFVKIDILEEHLLCLINKKEDHQ